MTRRPLTRVPILKSCVKCGRECQDGHALCPRCLAAANLSADLARPFPSLPMTTGEMRQALEAASFGSSVIAPEYVGSVCKHGFEDWRACGACTDAADFDDGTVTEP